VFVCVREKERETERDRKRENERERDRREQGRERIDMVSHSYAFQLKDMTHMGWLPLVGSFKS